MTLDDQIIMAREMYSRGAWINTIATKLHRGNVTINRWVADLKRPRKPGPCKKRKPVDLDACHERSIKKLIAADDAHLEDLRRGHARMWDGKDGVNAG
jgi:transposase